MNKEELKRKLVSRKFWVMVAGLVAGIVALFQGDPTVTVGGVVVAFGSIVAYIMGESWVDAANAGSSTTAINVSTTSKETADKLLNTGE